MDFFPPIDERLVAALATKFPDEAPALSMSDKEVLVQRWRSACCEVACAEA